MWTTFLGKLKTLSSMGYLTVNTQSYRVVIISSVTTKIFFIFYIVYIEYVPVNHICYGPWEGVCVDPRRGVAILGIGGPGPPKGDDKHQLSPDRGEEKT